MKYLLIFLSFFFMFSCSSDDAKYLSLLEPIKDCQSSMEFSLIETDSLSVDVPNNAFPTYEENQILHNRYLLCRKRKSHKVEIFDIIEKRHIRTLLLDANLLGDIGSFYAHNLDSIFFTKEPTEVLLLNGKNGQLIKKWQLDNAPINWSLTTKENENGIPLYYFPNIVRSIVGYDNVNHRLFVNLTNIDIWYFDKRKDFKLHGVFDLESNKWNLIYGHLPNIYATEGGQKIMYPFHHSLPFCLIKGDSSIVSFPLDHYIYIYNNRSGKLLSTHCTVSKNIQAIGKPLLYDVDFQQQSNFAVESPHYGQLSYHDKLKMYSRLYLHGEILKNNDGSIKKISEKKLSILFFNEKMEIVGECFFDKDKVYDKVGGTKNYAIALSDGFLATKKNQYINTDDKLHYSAYLQIQQIKNTN